MCRFDAGKGGRAAAEDTVPFGFDQVDVGIDVEPGGTLPFVAGFLLPF